MVSNSENYFEEQYQMLQDRMIQIFVNIPIGLVILDVDGTIEVVSSSLRSVLGYDPSELAGKTVSCIFETERSAVEISSFIKSDCPGKICLANLRKKDGSLLAVEFTSANLSKESMPGANPKTILCLLDRSLAFITL